MILDSIQVTGDEYLYQGMIWSKELEWLKKDLARVEHGFPIVIVTHIPLLTAFHNATEGATFPARPNRVIVNNVEILKIIKDYNVILVLQGHTHAKEMLVWRDTTFITGGAICGRWWRGSWHGTKEGFSLITLKGDQVAWEYIDYDWEARRP